MQSADGDRTFTRPRASGQPLQACTAVGFAINLPGTPAAIDRLRKRGTDMTVRVAAIGAGAMGADHARIVAEDVPGAVLQIVCDTDISRARAIAGKFDAKDVATDATAAQAPTRG